MWNRMGHRVDRGWKTELGSGTQMQGRSSCCFLAVVLQARLGFGWCTRAGRELTSFDQNEWPWSESELERSRDVFWNKTQNY